MIHAAATRSASLVTRAMESDLLRDRTLPTRVDEVIGGVLETECSVLLTDFFEKLRD
jgi:hypothetical protein